MSSLPNNSLFQRMSEKRILVLGDVMLDQFIWGNVHRISPEAPVPVVNVERESTYPGGAANVARNLVPFASGVRMAGLVGDDADGSALVRILEEGGIDAKGMLRAQEFTTITKTRIIAGHQQVVRIDRERITPVKEDQIARIAGYLENHTEELDGLIIEDYGKGFVTQGLADAVIPIAHAAGLVIAVDPNPNNPLEWRGVTVVKPNRIEAFRECGVAEYCWDAKCDPIHDRVLRDVGRQLLEKWETEMVQITLGEQGMILFKRDEEPHHIPTKAKDVFDVSGAGDTAIALFTLALTAGATPEHAAEISNYASGVVVGKLGTATLTPDELMEAMSREARVGRWESAKVGRYEDGKDFALSASGKVGR
ncbi:MAG: PfkB family carbohydrate kinase [Verrucomicrobiales bacterium]